TTVPWLPVVVVKGRIQDRPAGMPSVESIKELIYSDHSVADQLTGAFRITHDASGVRVMLQANNDHATNDCGLRQQLVALGHAQLSLSLNFDIVAPLAFPYRPVLDHERKFPYIAPAGQ
ncbi:MAG: hypothetical protein H7293_14245, partial [Candidatus Saccharibacteria bacterium]|nr:hypothetical protein [Rhodoferax sp.]